MEPTPKARFSEETEEIAVASSGEKESELLWEAEYQLTAEEKMACFRPGDKGFPSPMRLALRTAVLGLMAVGFAAYYFAEEPNGMSLFLAILCVILLTAVWFVPLWERKQIRKSAVSAPKTRLRGYEDAIAFGAGDDFIKLPFCDITVRGTEDLMVLELPAGQRLAVPRRGVDETAWQALTERANAPQKKTGWRGANG